MGDKQGWPSARPRLQRRFERSRLETELWEAVYEELLRQAVIDNPPAEPVDGERAPVVVACGATAMEVWR